MKAEGAPASRARPPLFSGSDRIRTREPGRLQPVPHRRGRGGLWLRLLAAGPPGFRPDDRGGSKAFDLPFLDER